MSSQTYLSTRGTSNDRSFEEVVLQGLAPDGGLYIPETVPEVFKDWGETWLSWSFEELAFRTLSVYISPNEIPPEDLRRIVDRSYATFDTREITPLIPLDKSKQLHLLELFHGPTYAFKDVALQFLGNLFEYFLVRRNDGKASHERDHLTVIGATSGDTGSAAIYGLRSKKDVSVFITYPSQKISQTQEAQMTSVLDDNVHNIAITESTFDDCQDFVKGLFGDQDINSTHKLGAVNSINWARILAQITYYFYAYSQILRSASTPPECLRFVVPTGNFGDVLAGYFALRMGLPIDKLVVATNENDILWRFWQDGSYEKDSDRWHKINGENSQKGIESHLSGVRETHSPAMDILVSSNFERLLWFLALEVHGTGSVKEQQAIACTYVQKWQEKLKSSGGFHVGPEMLKAALKHFESERVTNDETLDTIRETHAATKATPLRTPGAEEIPGYVLDPHTAVGIAASHRSIARCRLPGTVHVSLATAHPAKFDEPVKKALKDEKGFSFEELLPDALRQLKDKERRVEKIPKSAGLEALKTFIRKHAPAVGSATA